MNTRIEKYLNEKNMSSSDKGRLIGEFNSEVNKILEDFFKKNKSKYGEEEALKLQWTALDNLVREMTKKRDTTKREAIKKGIDI